MDEWMYKRLLDVGHWIDDWQSDEQLKEYQIVDEWMDVEYWTIIN